ncbi:heterokaryon incompatibility protein-domain-containing protein [Leptodontidium sp. MPI-SDFR-AT-0119]|nr:heterokaryon incompatibility protein-domain-containing protein [Leptodontidium sp. MPI-SDFR-AT-0119]
MTDITRYQYRPIVEGDGIRLLELEPNSDFGATIQCSLIHTTLKEYDEDLINHYTALSYVWGDAKVTKSIMVEGFGVDITINLDSALRYMRDTSRKRLIWADAICINQSDDEEKNNQVRQMGKVYRCATHTIIFLGEPTANTNFILKELQFSQTWKSIEMSEDLPWNDILTRAWFQRVWVYQELIFSLDPWVQCGHLRVRWEVLYRNIENLKASNQHVEPWKAILQMGSGRKRLVSDVGRRGNASFSELLISTLEARRGQGVFDPRDMLFAHTSILSVAAASPEIQALTNVDYKKTCAEVYVDIVKHMLLSSRAPSPSYGIFSYAEAAVERTTVDRELQIPSWAPNWMQKTPPYPYRRLRQAVELAQVRLGYNSKNVFHHEHPKPHQLWLGPSSSMILVTGLIVGTLRQVSQVITSTRANMKFPPDGTTASSWTKDDEDVGGKVYTARNTISNNWVDILLPVMTLRRSDIAMAIISTFGRQDLLPGEDGLDGFSHRSTRRQLFMLNRGSDNILRHLFLHAITDASDDKLYPHFLYGRKFAALEDGRLALVPGSAQPGDSICYFFGDSTVPFLLRPRPRPADPNITASADYAVRQSMILKHSPDFRHFEFVGECIIDGLITSSPTRANLAKVLGIHKTQEKVFIIH